MMATMTALNDVLWSEVFTVFGAGVTVVEVIGFVTGAWCVRLVELASTSADGQCAACTAGELDGVGADHLHREHSPGRRCDDDRAVAARHVRAGPQGPPVLVAHGPAVFDLPRGVQALVVA